MDKIVSAVSVAIILIAPWTPVKFVENLFARFVLLAWILYSMYLGTLPGLFGLLASYSILIERNNTLLHGFVQHNIIPKVATVVNANIPAVPASPTVHVEEANHYEIHDDEKGNFENPHVEDNNPRFEELPSNSAMPTFFKNANVL